MEMLYLKSLTGTLAEGPKTTTIHTRDTLRNLPLAFLMTDVLYQSLKMMRERPFSMSLLSLVISSGKYSSSLSTINKVPGVNTHTHTQTNALVILRIEAV